MSELKNNNAVVFAFDLGQVIFNFDYLPALNRLRGRLNVDPQEIINRIYNNNFGMDFEKGLIKPQDFFERFQTDFSVKLDFQEFAFIWNNIFWPNDQIIGLLTRLKKDYPIFLISNINEMHYDYLHTLYPQVFALFKKLILSYQVKAVKPEKEIYEVLRQSADCAYENIIYIDDRQDLIEAAKPLKMKCLQFVNYERLSADLLCLGIKKERIAL
jgi:putative hydrolase of the HAD superfamily